MKRFDRERDTRRVGFKEPIPARARVRPGRRMAAVVVALGALAMAGSGVLVFAWASGVSDQSGDGILGHALGGSLVVLALVFLLLARAGWRH